MEPLWLRIAYQDLRRGIREIPGPQHHQRILDAHALCTLKATTDEVPWCSAMVNLWMHEAHVKITKSAAARSWLTWGVAVSPIHPPIGAVVVLQRGGANQPGPEVRDAPGHVGLFWGHGEPGRVLVLGGNQSDAVTIASYPATRLLGFRWPI